MTVPILNLRFKPKIMANIIGIMAHAHQRNQPARHQKVALCEELMLAQNTSFLAFLSSTHVLKLCKTTPDHLSRSKFSISSLV